MNKEEVISYLKNISFIITAFVFLIFPVFFLTNTTDLFIFPKQFLIVIVTSVLLILWSARMLLEKRVTFRSTPFNLPIIIFGTVVLISALLSKNLYDSLMQAVPLLFLIGLYFVVVNNIENKLSFKIILHSLILGAALSSLLTVAYYFKLYIFPFAGTQSQYFNTQGSPIQQLIYITPLLLVSLFSMYKIIKSKNYNSYEGMAFGVSSVLMGVAFIVLSYQVFLSPQKVVILPIVYGFQIALATISQDAQRFVFSFLFGSGYGTFLTDFTRFRLPSFNQETNIWNLTFSYSSTYFLEILSTVGLLGGLSFLFLLAKTVKVKLAKINIIYVAVLVTFLLSFLLPFSFTPLFLLFMLLALFGSLLYLDKTGQSHNVVLSLVAFKQGLFSFESEKEYKQSFPSDKSESVGLPVIVLAIVVIICGFVGLNSVKLFVSDLELKQSFAELSLNNGQKAYDLQRSAIQDFQYKSDYYRVFSQLNLALANSLANAAPKSASPSSQVQQTVVALIQQGINSGKAATTLSPMTAANWENLSQIYRNLINIGQNADQFSIATIQQAIMLDPFNPQLYIELGGIYFQLGQYDAAQSQFETAINLKKDLANGYYNLGHALEAKGDLKSALAAYQNVKVLVKDDKASVDKISAEISVIEQKIGEQGKTQPTTEAKQTPGNQPPLEVSTSSSKLKAETPVKIPAPTITITPKPSTTPSITPAVSPSPVQ